MNLNLSLLGCYGISKYNKPGFCHLIPRFQSVTLLKLFAEQFKGWFGKDITII